MLTIPRTKSSDKKWCLKSITSGSYGTKQSRMSPTVKPDLCVQRCAAWKSWLGWRWQIECWGAHGRGLQLGLGRERPLGNLPNGSGTPVSFLRDGSDLSKDFVGKRIHENRGGWNYVEKGENLVFSLFCCSFSQVISLSLTWNIFCFFSPSSHIPLQSPLTTALLLCSEP